MRTRRPVRRRQSGNLVVTIVLILGLAVVAIIAIAAFGPYNSDNDSREQRHAVVPVDPTEDDYKQRGFQPNIPEPVKPEPPKPEPPKPEPPEPDPPGPTEKILFVGRADWHVYHRLTCKYARRIARDNLVTFASTDAARTGGYVPCKICKPPAGQEPTQVAVGPTDPQPVVRPKPPRPRPRPKSGPVKFRTVPVNFPYTVVEREADDYQDIFRVDYTIDVDRALKRDEALSLARKLVKTETGKGAINAVSFIIRRKVRRRGDTKWIIWIDWGPYGSVAKAGMFAAGDYHAHEFHIVLEGVQ